MSETWIDWISITFPPIIVGITACGLGFWLLPKIELLLFQAGFVRQNYKGDDVTPATGIIIPFIVTPIFLLLTLLIGVDVSGWLIVIFGMAFAGLVDDLAGNRKTSGLIGHLHSWRIMEPTTGALKALLGLLISLYAGYSLQPAFQPIVLATLNGLLSGLIIALSANVINLLDVRPGRALKGYGILMILAVIGASFATNSVYPYAHTIVAAAPFGASLALWPQDVKGRSMLGDTGANVLGASAGVLAVFSPFLFKVVLLTILVIIHIASEKRSLSDLIGSNRFLRWIDGLGRAE